jgi:putative transposase
VRQCELADVSRSPIYATPSLPLINNNDLLISKLIDEEYTCHPFYGSRRMVVALAKDGHIVNRKRVQRLMRAMGLAGMAPGPNTSQPSPEHHVYPYLLRGVPVVRPNQVWSTDITYSAPNLRRLPGMVLSKLEHAWNAFRITKEETNWMSAPCY